MRRDKSLLYARIAMAILFSCLFICSNSYYYEFESKGVGLFSGLFHVTVTTHIFHLFIIVITCLVLQLSGFFPRKLWTNKYSSIKDILFMKIVYYTSTLFNKTSDQYKIIEYPLIILFVVIGGTFLISSSDMISIFLSIELQSYGLYILCAIYRNSERATGGALVYFLLGGLSSCFILLAFGLLYSNCGNTSFDNIYIINNINNVTGDLPSKLQMTFDSLYESSYLHLSLIIMSVGFLFKVSAAPFHFWSPDVYDSIPTLVTTFVAVFAKISIFVMLLELVHYTTNIYQETNNLSSDFSWTFTLLISSILSLIIGAVLGLTQFRIKRLYAYSTISHIGFILLALTINTIESVQSFIFYLMQYSLTNLNAFIILVSIGYSLYLYVKNKDDKITEDSEKNSDDKLLDKNNSPIQLVDQVKGLFYINPTLSLSLAITLFSFVGIPPLVGFFAKQMVLSSALDNGYVFITLIAILSSVISAYYYLAVVKQMFFYKASFGTNPELEKANYKINIINRFDQSNDNIELGLSNMQLSGSLSITISSLSLVILLFILNPQEWLNMASILALIMFNC